MSVEILRGGHSHPVPCGTRELLEGKLRKAEFPVDWKFKVRHGPAVKGTCHMPSFSVRCVDEDRMTVEVVTKPGGNDTARVMWIYPPNGHTPQRLYDALRKSAEPKEKSGEVPSPLVSSKLVEQNTSREISLVGFAADRRNAALVVCAIGTHLDESGWISADNARDAVRAEMGINASNRSLGRMIGSVAKKGFLEADMKTHGSDPPKPVAYRPSQEGHLLVTKFLPDKVLGEPLAISTLPQPSQEEAEVVAVEAPTKQLHGEISIRGIGEKLEELELEILIHQEEIQKLQERRRRLEEALAVIKSELS